MTKIQITTRYDMRQIVRDWADAEDTITRLDKMIRRASRRTERAQNAVVNALTRGDHDGNISGLRQILIGCQTMARMMQRRRSVVRDNLGLMDDLIAWLQPDEQQIIMYHYRWGLTWAELARGWGHDESYYRRREARILDKLRMVWSIEMEMRRRLSNDDGEVCVRGNW